MSDGDLTPTRHYLRALQTVTGPALASMRLSWKQFFFTRVLQQSSESATHTPTPSRLLHVAPSAESTSGINPILTAPYLPSVCLHAPLLTSSIRDQLYSRPVVRLCTYLDALTDTSAPNVPTCTIDVICLSNISSSPTPTLHSPIGAPRRSNYLAEASHNPGY